MYWQGFEDVDELPKVGKKAVMYVLCEDEDKDTFWEYIDNCWVQIELGTK